MAGATRTTCIVGVPIIRGTQALAASRTEGHCAVARAIGQIDGGTTLAPANADRTFWLDGSAASNGHLDGHLFGVGGSHGVC